MPGKRLIRDSTRLLTQNWKTTSMIIIFDILFLVLLPNIRFIIINFNTGFFSLIYNAGLTARLVASVFLLITEILLFVSVYSFFKYIVLGFAQNYFNKKELGFSRFVAFLKLNLIALAPIVIILFLFIMSTSFYFNKGLTEWINSPSKLLFTLIVTSIIGLILFIYSYTLLNLFHFIFLREKSLKKIVRGAFMMSFKPRSYKMFGANIRIILIFGAILLAVHIFMRVFVLTSLTAYLKYFGHYRLFLALSSILAGYFLLLLNRLNFYRLCNMRGIN